MTTKTLDVRKLGHGEREGVIFPGVQNLAPGEMLRLVVEFNPVPLVYMLKAQGEFELQYEKEGPEEWILNVKRIAPAENKKEQFKELLQELKQGDATEETKAKAKKLLQAVDATTLGLMEQELIREGIPHDEIRKSLCDIHLETLRDSLVAQKIDPPTGHPVHTLMEEHKIILKNLSELDALLGRLKKAINFEEMGQDLAKLAEIAHILVEAENHHRREEEVLFPALGKHDIVEPPQIMKLEHIDLRERKHQLDEVAHNYQNYDFVGFKEKAIEAGEFLTETLESHIFKEDNILYQIALQVLSPDEWEKIKQENDKIGYCCFIPAGLIEGHIGEERRTIMELDLRPMPPFERHDKIFEDWEALKPGDTLRIINDHDPKPLHYQFEVEYKGRYEWEYEQQGPRDWVVKIKKLEG